MEVDLRGCLALREAALDAAVRSIRLSAPPHFLLELDFLVPVKGDEARAKLNKRSHQLVITVPKA